MLRYELTDSQQHFVCAAQHLESSKCYIIAEAFEIPALIQRSNIIAAIREMAVSHDVLRAYYSPDRSELFCDEANQSAFLFESGDHPCRVVRAPQFKDAESWISFVEGVRRREESTPFDLDVPPLMRATVIDGGDKFALVIASHHSLCDGVSFVTLVRELFQRLQKEGTVRVRAQSDLKILFAKQSSEKSDKGRRAFWEEEISRIKAVPTDVQVSMSDIYTVQTVEIDKNAGGELRKDSFFSGANEAILFLHIASRRALYRELCC